MIDKSTLSMIIDVDIADFRSTFTFGAYIRCIILAYFDIFEGRDCETYITYNI